MKHRVMDFSVMGFSVIGILLLAVFTLTFIANPTGMASKQIIPQGKFLPAWDESKCVDSDNGIKLDKVGTTRGMLNGKFAVKSDFCVDSKQITEFFCGRNKNILNVSGNCPIDSSCVNSRCLADKYLVAVRTSSTFSNVAVTLATGKKSQLIEYLDLNDLLNKLKVSKPKYLAIVAAPEELTPDFMFELDSIITLIDEDQFYDLSYGYITSFNEKDALEYVNRILTYKTPAALKVYYPFQSGEIVPKLNKYAVDVTYGCLDVWTPFTIPCNPEDIHYMDKIAELSSTHGLLWFNVHGQPNELLFNGEERIVGNANGATGMKYLGPGVECWCKDGQNIGKFNSLEGSSPPEADQMCINLTGSIDGMTCIGTSLFDEIPITTKASLVYAESCITARINGVPSNDIPELDPVLSTGENELIGQINDSMVLSFLKSGAYSYIGTNVLANSGFMPKDQLLNQAILGGKSLGETLKEFKNENMARYLLIPEGETFTSSLEKVQITSWALFGDPQQRISLRNDKVEDCVKSMIKVAEDKYNITLFFNSSIINANLEVVTQIEPTGDSFNQLSYSACLVKVPKRINQTVRVFNLTLPEGYSPLTPSNYHWDLGEEEYIVYPQTIPNQEINFWVELK